MRQYNTETNVNAITEAVFARYKKMFDEFEQDQKDWYEENPKYKYPTCIHGTDQWTDYDNICGPCEDGLGYWDEERFREISKADAEYFCETLQKDYEEHLRIFEAVSKTVDMFSKSAPVKAFIEWHGEQKREMDARMLKKLGLDAE